MVLDRRRAERERRFARRVPAVFAVKDESGPRVILGQAEDITPAGIALRWPRDAEPPPRSDVALTFELPGTRQPIAALGQVVSDRRSGRFRRTGVRFTSLTPDAAALIERYCRARAR